jgi:hypothetical protein
MAEVTVSIITDSELYKITLLSITVLYLSVFHSKESKLSAEIEKNFN